MAMTTTNQNQNAELKIPNGFLSHVLPFNERVSIDLFLNDTLPHLSVADINAIYWVFDQALSGIFGNLRDEISVAECDVEGAETEIARLNEAMTKTQLLLWEKVEFDPQIEAHKRERVQRWQDAHKTEREPSPAELEAFERTLPDDLPF